MTTAALIDAFESWSAEGQPLVLATVYETEGSTYSKAGAQMLITGEATFQGMLSGGCLEGDLAERARAVIESGIPQAVTYDLGQNDEELWGLGVGCDGLMRIFLQLLEPGKEYEPFRTMARALGGDSVQVAATVIESSIDGLEPGSTVVTVNGDVAYADIASEQSVVIRSLVESTLVDPVSRTETIGAGDDQALILLTALTPPPSILVLGAGLDSGPVVRFALELGWRVTVQDHRPAYIESGDFEGAREVHCVPVDELATIVDLDRFDAAIIMSHHLVSDRKYLAQLAESEMRYIGLLGPADRRRRLLEELGDVGRVLEDRVHGPAGIDIGGRGPAAIALSIIAEMHGALMSPATAKDQDS
jgi:xanthine dehydrogenase accessory factor